MIQRPSLHVLGLATLLTVAACGQADDKGEAAPSTTVAPSAESAAPSSLTTDSAPRPAPANPAIRTAAGPEGTTVELTRMQVTGNIMTVELRYSPPAGATGSQWVYFPLNEVSLIDDATSQRYGVLQDEQKHWMASPLSGGRIALAMRDGNSALVWFKFPAPPASSPTVSVNIPSVSPFDGVPVTR